MVRKFLITFIKDIFIKHILIKFIKIIIKFNNTAKKYFLLDKLFSHNVNIFFNTSQHS